jgi:hypothetical protein
VETINEPMRIKIPSIRDSTKAAVGRSTGMPNACYDIFKTFSTYFQLSITFRGNL